MTNKEIARVLKEVGALIELSGGNTFRSRAYLNAARTVDQMELQIGTLPPDVEVLDVPGIGKGIFAQIRELLCTGTFDLREELLGSLPPGVVELLSIRGLGAKRIRRLWQELGVDSVEKLEEAALTGRIATLGGFGPKSEEQILKAVQFYRSSHSYRHIDVAFALVAPLVEQLRALPGVDRVEVAGEMRRRLEIVQRADVVVSTSDRKATEVALPASFVKVEHPEADAVYDGKLEGGFPARLVMTSPERFGYTLWRTTGSEAHCEKFFTRYGPPAETGEEADLYTGIGLSYVPPELREDRGEIEEAAAGTLPALIETFDLKGCLHNHTTYSDGAHTLREMAEAARAMGYSYFAVCDHSRSLSIANGLSIERLREQQAEIADLNRQFAADRAKPFRIFSGIESDILADGSLDYPEDVLDSLDLVVASVHTGLKMDREEATERVLRAVNNPYTTILGHATGRLLLQREGYPLDFERIFDACTRNGVAIEVNANPRRLDLDWRWIRMATDRGVLISINPDAHSTSQLHLVEWGVGVARKGRLTPAQCLNALPLEAFEAWLAARRKSRNEAR